MIPTQSSIPDRVKGAVFLPVGLGLLVAAMLCFASTRDWLRRSQLAPGRVIAENHGSHHVEVGFHTADGRAIRYAQNGMVTLHRGEVVLVRYDPATPAMDPCVDQWLATWESVIFLGLMGSVFAAGGWQMLRSPGRSVI